MLSAVLASVLAFLSVLCAFPALYGGVPVLEGLSAALGRLGTIGPFAAYRRRESLRERRRSCLVHLPVLLDVLTLGLTAGLSFDASLELYCSRYRNDLSASLSEAMASWRIGLSTRSEALAHLAEELDVDALQRFASAVNEALAFGSPLADVLEHQAQAIRDEHRSHVEEEIEKVPVKMLIPLGTLIVPAMLLAILGPLMGPAFNSF